MNISNLGHFPVDGEAARASGSFYKIKPEDALAVISDTRQPTLMKFFVSNDVVSVGELIIPTGGIGPRQTAWDSHPGDAIFYVKEGPLTFLLPEAGETYQVSNGDFMYIPENNRYKIINYTAQTAKAVFLVAPTM